MSSPSLLSPILLAGSLALLPFSAFAQGKGESTAPVWVFLTDRTETRPGFFPSLSEEAWERRMRVRQDQGFDHRDAPLDPTSLQAVRETGVRIRHTSRWLNAVSVEASPSQRQALSRLSAVKSIRSVAKRKSDGPRSMTSPSVLPSRRALTSWPPLPEDYGASLDQLSLLNVPALHECGLDGTGVMVGIQDTGFFRGHQALEGAMVVGEWDFLAGDGVTTDETEAEAGASQDAHGTMVMSLIAANAPGAMLGVAPHASFLLSKTEDVSQEVPSEEDAWVAGVEWQEAEGAALVTSSLGYIDWYLPEDMDGATAVTTLAAQIAVENGLILLNSAGNSGPLPGTLIAPADAEGVLTVGAVDLEGIIASFSSRGPTADGRIKPDVAAMGVGNLVASPDSLDAYQTGSGTSFAAPLTAGVVALLLQAYPWWGPAEIRAALTHSASHPDAPDNDMGAGIVDAQAAAGLYCTCWDLDGDRHFDAACGGDDCDDGEASIAPGEEELCDERDTNCDGLRLPEEEDSDGDGFSICMDSDCDDGDPGAWPGSIEIPYDAIDQDCDGADLTDQDGDGWDASEAGGLDCDDGDPDRHPGSVDFPYDGIDQDCSGGDLIDQDEDGWDAEEAAGSDCDDNDASRHPEALEECSDGIDNDCDGAVDGQDQADCPTPAGEDDLSSEVGCAPGCDAGGKGNPPQALLLAGLAFASRRRIRR